MSQIKIACKLLILSDIKENSTNNTEKVATLFYWIKNYYYNKWHVL